MFPLIFQSVKCHMFSDFENVCTIILEYLLQMIESKKTELFAFID